MADQSIDLGRKLAMQELARAVGGAFVDDADLIGFRRGRFDPRKKLADCRSFVVAGDDT